MGSFGDLNPSQKFFVNKYNLQPPTKNYFSVTALGEPIVRESSFPEQITEPITRKSSVSEQLLEQN